MNALFLRIPKTASTSVLETANSSKKLFESRKINKIKKFIKLNEGYIIYHNTHLYLNVMNRSNQWFNLKKMFTFGFVRNPWERAVSCWKFGCYQSVGGSEWDMSFRDFCFKLNSIDISPKTGIADNGLLLHICEQHPFLICEEYKTKADFIGRFENLQEDFNIVCSKIGIPQCQLQEQNITKHKHYTEYYDDETKSIVAEKYAKDIEYFNYEFGGKI